MTAVVRILLLAGIVCLISSGEASAKTSFCYFHHNCPADGKLPKRGPPGLYTKRQCKNGGGYSWGAGPTSCENLR